jgi:large subunit ribosomal protein L21
MYAVIRTGGKQARVAPGESVRLEKLDGAVGDTVELSEVLLVGALRGAAGG